MLIYKLHTLLSTRLVYLYMIIQVYLYYCIHHSDIPVEQHAYNGLLKL